jgi:hypothetical protein
MPTIDLTNNTTLNLTASSADSNNTLKKYLQQDLNLKAPDGFEKAAAKTVGATDASGFPIKLSATAEGKFAVEKTTLDVQAGVSASLGLLKGDDVKSVTDFAFPNLVSFGLTGTASVGESATADDLTFGISGAASFALTGYAAPADTDKLGAAIEAAMGALTIPRTIQDITDMRPNTVCQLDSSGSLKFSASVAYSFLNNPLATVAIPSLPAIPLSAGGKVTLAASVTHTSDHTLTVTRLPGSLLHLSVSVTNTNDFATSLTASAGITAMVGNQDALAFLLGLIAPNSTDEVNRLKADLPPDQFKKLSGDIKSAIDSAVSKSLQISLAAALDNSTSHKTLFAFEIDLNALDKDTSDPVLLAALTGDFTAITTSGGLPPGIKRIGLTVTDTTKITHSLAFHLLGIFNHDSINTFMKKATVSSVDGSQIVLSDESIDVTLNNLDADKLRQIIVKSATLTLPAVGAAGGNATMSLVFFDRKASTKPQQMREFVNALLALGPSAASHSASALFAKSLKNYGACSLFLGMSLTADQCKQIFKSTDTTSYILKYADSETTILSGDPDSADRLSLFGQPAAVWKRLQDAPSRQNIIIELRNDGIPESAAQFLVADVLTGVFWSSAMVNFAKAVAAGASLAKPGAQFVKNSTLGFGEPWLILTVAKLLTNAQVQAEFTSSLVSPVA